MRDTPAEREATPAPNRERAIDGTTASAAVPIMGRKAGELATPTDPAAVEALRLRSPGQHRNVDPDLLVWVPDAFPGFVSYEEHAICRQIIGDRSRTPHGERDSSSARAADGNVPADEPEAVAPNRKELAAAARDRVLLPTMRCGAPTPAGHRCGRALRASNGPQGVVIFRNERCLTGPDAHGSQFSRSVEQPILAAITRAVRIEHIDQAMRDVTGRVQADRVALKPIERELAEVDALEHRAGESELRAEIALDAARAADDADACAAATEDAAHFRRLRIELQRRQTSLQQSAAAVRQRLADASTDEEVRAALGVVKEACGRLEDLFTRLRDQPRLLRMLVGIVTRVITIRNVSRGLALAEIEFQNGAVLHVLIVTMPMASTQPQRALARALLGAGAAPDRLVSMIRPATTTTNAVVLDGEWVRAYALLGAHFETEHGRTGPLETLPNLSLRLGREPNDVLSHVMTGALGPIEVSPTHSAARSRASGDESPDQKRNTSMPPTDTGAGRSTRSGAGRTEEADPTAGGALIMDLSGILLAPTEEELEYRFPEYAHARTAERAGCAPDELVLRSTMRNERGLRDHEFRALLGTRGQRAVLYDLARRRYLRQRDLTPALLAIPVQAIPDEAALFRDRVRDAVIAAGYVDLDPADFEPLHTLRASWAARNLSVSYSALANAYKLGRIVAVHVRRPRNEPGAPNVLVAYCPARIRDSDAATVWQWVRGEIGGATPPQDRRC